MLRATAITTLAVAMVALTGCNIMAGLGRDVQLAGAALRGATEGSTRVVDTAIEADEQLAAQPWPSDPQLPGQPGLVLEPVEDQFITTQTPQQQQFQQQQPDYSDEQTYQQYYEAHRQYQSLH